MMTTTNNSKDNTPVTNTVKTSAAVASPPMADHLVGDWQQWVVRNIEQGVVEQTLIAAATREIRAAWAQRSAGLRHRSESQGYRYATAPTPNTPANGVVQLGERSIPVLLNRAQPRIVHYGNVLSQAECEAMMALAQPALAPSQTRDHASAELVVRDFRSSQGMFLKRGENALVELIEQRLATLAQWPVEHAEGLQILHYQAGGQYRPHFDFFPPESPPSPLSLRNGGQRVATLIVYLNTVQDGGETFFPKLNLKIKPVQGQALYFAYTNADNELDRMTLHGGEPVGKGEKWIMTKWMRQNPCQP
jgi:prolyl 4-hydroxylase